MTQLGNLPPQAIELEEAVLGAVMEIKDAILPVLNILKTESFYTERHQIIYSACIDLYAKSAPIDILTVAEEIKSRGKLDIIGGRHYLMEITSRVASSANTEFHCAIIEQCYLRRQIIALSAAVQHLAYSDAEDVFEVLNTHQTNLFKLLSGHNGRTIHSLGSIISQRLIEYKKEKPNGLTGVGAGFIDLDKITGGFQNSDLIIIAARPAMGKTAFAMQIAKNAATQFEVPVGVFELEMSKERLTDRLISNETSVFQDKLLKRELNEYDIKQLEYGVKNLVNVKLFIDDTPSISIMSLRSKALQLKQKHNIGLLVVDYLQLMQGSRDKKGNREQEISEISRGLKIIAKELNIPVIALSQLSRAVENRPGGAKRPMLSDLRESGSIEQDADMVMFLYRPEYYGIEYDEANESTAGLVEVIISKHRNGICDTVKVDFNGAFMRFKNWGELPEINPNRFMPTSEHF